MGIQGSLGGRGDVWPRGCRGGVLGVENMIRFFFEGVRRRTAICTAGEEEKKDEQANRVRGYEKKLQKSPIQASHTQNSLFFTPRLRALPPSLTSTRTLPGLLQSLGCTFPGSNTVSSPSSWAASTISRARGFGTASSWPTRRPWALVRPASKYSG